MPHLLYIGQTPAEGTGSPVIILRHLTRLAAEGWQISILSETGQDNSACVRAGWNLLTLPLRRAWWPPFRATITPLRTLRTWLLARECGRLTAAHPPDAVLSYLAAHDDFYPEIAARFSARIGAPLTVLVHDHAAAFAHQPAVQRKLHRRHVALLRRAHRCWFVSPELAAVYELPLDARRVLPPLPAAETLAARWQPAFALWPRVYYAGSLWPEQLPLLRQIAQTLTEAGACLVLISRSTPALDEFLRVDPVEHRSPFATNREALAHLAQHAAGVLVAYAATVDEMPWVATSFPSKLVEYAQLGLPCAIVAPVDSAVGRWSNHHRAVDFFGPADQARLAAWARALREEATWQERTVSIRHLAAGEFSPEKIHATFAAGLRRT